MKHRGIILFIVWLFVGTIGTNAFAKVVDASNDMSWLDGFTLVVLESDDVAGIQRARQTIQAHGGRVAIMALPSYILGWVPYELRAELVGTAGIQDIYYTEVSPSDVMAGRTPTGRAAPGEAHARDAQARFMIHYFNAVVRGDVQRKYFEDRAAAANAPANAPGWPQGTTDALPREAIDETAYLRNLEDAGLDVGQLKDRGVLLQPSIQGAVGNSDAMTGTISVTIFFAESNGGSDPNLYTWSDQHMQDYVNGVNTGLAWWTTKSYEYFDCWNAFFVHFFPGTDSRCQQPYEPVLHDATGSGIDSRTWVSLIMNNFGFTGGSHFSQVDAYNTSQRVTYGTDWAYSAFVGYNPPPAADRYTDGTGAFAWLNGPYTVLLHRSFSWNPEQVFTHESGHIFGTCDEYNGSNCSCTNCLGKPNQNCHLCSGGSCMMKLNTFNLCAWTPGQLGWTGAGCAPAPLPAPAPSGVSPPGEMQGVTATLTINGSSFLFGAEVDLGPNVTVNGVTFVNSTTLTADIVISNTAPTGFVDMMVTNRDLQSSVLIGALEIQATKFHYASPTGGNVFPYVTPTDAAISLVDALNAAADGDSLLVESATYNNIALNILEGVQMYGGWNSTFTSRDLVTGKSVLDLNKNVTINAGADAVVIDGFVLENGSGEFQNSPIAGNYGGGIRILSSTATVSNCEIRTNDVSPGGTFGAGGAIYASASTVDFHDNTMSGNRAGQGGAIYLTACSGTVANNSIVNNELQFTSEASHGGGVFVDSCTSLALSGNTIDGNTSVAQASDGAGLYVLGTTGLTMSGDVVSNNSTNSGGDGGGMYVKTSAVTFDGVTFSFNQAALFGGAISADFSSVLSLIECSFLWNTGGIGGGFYFSNGTYDVTHSLLVGNTATITGGGAYFISPAGGSFVGNTLDRNTSSNAGGVVFSNANFAAFNNIITNSGDAGVTCSGVTTPTLRYNNVWNSSGANYSGCSDSGGGISGDPVFSDTANGDYHLAAHSPSIDAGDPAPAYDDPDASRGDMGRYGSHTFVMDQPEYPKGLSATQSAGNVILSWTPNPELDVASYAVYKDTISSFVPSLANFVQFVLAPDSSVNLGPADNSHYRIAAVDTSGYSSGYSTSQTVIATGIGDGPVSYVFELHQNMPNPFNPVTRIRYEIAERTPVRLDVFDVRGQRIRRLVNGAQGPGVFSVTWDGRNSAGARVSSGIYFYRLDAGSRVETRKMVLIK